ncbi:MAG TPA: hypothetical protein VML55_02470 [Planctomycetaceae bacterium]|nr:hypothetical protein [Planctomycetaceae bacterium]
MIACSEALRIADSDAEAAYRDPSGFRISVSLEDDVWQIDYELKDPRLQGGGPHYLIDAETGEIRSRRYEQ